MQQMRRDAAITRQAVTYHHLPPPPEQTSDLGRVPDQEVALEPVKIAFVASSHCRGRWHNSSGVAIT